MSDKDIKRVGRAGDDEALAKLFKLAGPRAAISRGARERVYSRVLDEWETSSPGAASTRTYASVLRAWQRRDSGPRLRHWLLPIVVTAGAAFAMVVVLQPETPPPVSVATVSKVIAGNTATTLPDTGATLYVGDRLTTAAGEGISLRLSRGESLRVHGNSELELGAGNRIKLIAGSIYADTGDFVYRDRGLVIDTAFGIVRDIGTQFAVTSGGMLLDIAVREGRVDLEQDRGERVAIAGERLLVRADGSAERQAVAPDADYWDWATRLAPSFDIEGKTLLEFLKWVARESGMQLEFQSADIRLATMRTDLHGTIGDSGPLAALDAVVATTAFRVRTDGDRIIIDR